MIKLNTNFSIQTLTKTNHDKSDLILLEKKEKIYYVEDVACQFDSRIEKKEKDKLKNYTDLKYEIIKMWKDEVTKVSIVTVVICALKICGVG